MKDSETKKWVRISRTAKGDVWVKVTLQRGMASANWCVKGYTPAADMKAAIVQATKGAEEALAVIEEVLG